MSIIIPDSILAASRMSDRELMQEIAIMLYAKDKLTLGQASRLADIKQDAFQRILGSREIPPHYDVEDLRQDIENLKTLGRW